MSDSLESGVDADEDSIDAAWKVLEASWDEPEAHQRFVALCLTQNRLDAAGKRYRKVRDEDEDPERRAEANRQIDRILAKALVNLEILRSPPPPKRNTTLLLIATLVFVLLLGGATWAVLGVP